MRMHVNDIYRTLQQLFKKALKAYNEKHTRFHFHTNIYIAALMLLTTGN